MMIGLETSKRNLCVKEENTYLSFFEFLLNFTFGISRNLSSLECRKERGRSSTCYIHTCCQAVGSGPVTICSVVSQKIRMRCERSTGLRNHVWHDKDPLLRGQKCQALAINRQAYR